MSSRVKNKSFNYFLIIFFLFGKLFSNDTIRVNFDLFEEYHNIPILGGNLKPSLQPPWNQQDFLDNLILLQPQTLRWPGAEAANYFDWHQGSLLPCYKWLESSHPFDHVDNNICGQQWEQFCLEGDIYPKTIQTELMNGKMRSVNYVDNYASNYMNAIKNIRQSIDGKSMVPFFTLNVLSPDYYHPDSVEFGENCNVINTEPVNTISHQLDSIATLTMGMDEVFVQLGNEPWHTQSYKDGIMSNALDYFRKMVTIAREIDNHSGLQHVKVGLFADVHSNDIEDDSCEPVRCTWNDSMHVILNVENAHDLFDAYSLHKYSGLKRMRIPSNFDEHCEPIEPITWLPIEIEDMPEFNSCQMVYLIKWMIIDQDNMFLNWSGNNQYPGLSSSLFGNQPKEIWITEYDMGLDGQEAYDKLYSNGWLHAIYNLYTTLKYMVELPRIEILIQNNMVGYSGGYRLIDTFSYLNQNGTNNSKYHDYWESEIQLRPLVSHSFEGLSPKGEAMRILNELAWRNNQISEINFNMSEVDSTEIRSYDGVNSYYAKDMYGWIFDQDDLLFMNISNDTIPLELSSIGASCLNYDFTIIEGDLYARNYQTEFGTSLPYDTLLHHQVSLWEFESEVPPLSMENYFAATYSINKTIGSIDGNQLIIQIPPHSITQMLKDDLFNEEIYNCDGTCINDIDQDDICDELSLVNKEIMEKYNIDSIYPNPFNPITNITFSMEKSGITSIKIYDIIGRELEVLHNGFLNKGDHSIIWNARNYSSGIYFIRMEVNAFEQIQKAILFK